MKRLLDRLAGWIVLGLVRIRLRLPDPAAERFGAAAGRLALWAIPSRRRIARRNLDRAFGGTKSPGELDRILAEAYRLIAVSFCDLLTLLRDSPDQVRSRIVVEGEANLRAALREGKGVIGVSAHFGNFTFLAVTLPALGVPTSYMYRRVKNPQVADLVDALVAASGSRTIEDAPRHTAGLRALEALSRGEAVVMLIDQHYPAGVEVPFFGAPAKTAIGAAFLAARSGAPLVPMRALRLPGGRLRFVIDEPVAPPADRSREAITACMARLTGVLEGWIRETPEAWFWVHRRWKDLDRAEAATG